MVTRVSSSVARASSLNIRCRQGVILRPMIGVSVAPEASETVSVQIPPPLFDFT